LPQTSGEGAERTHSSYGNRPRLPQTSGEGAERTATGGGVRFGRPPAPGLRRRPGPRPLADRRLQVLLLLISPFASWRLGVR
jgi:hypothetical protein